MHTKNIYLLFVLCSIILSCTQEYPEPIQETPVFFIDGTINGVSTNLSAGDNEIEQTTEKFQNAMGIYEYSSTLGDFSSPNSEALMVKINGANINEINQNELLSNSIHTGEYEFTTFTNSIDPSSFKVYSQCSDPLATYTWNFNDSPTFLNEQNPTFTSAAITGIDSVTLAIITSSGAVFSSSQYLFNTNEQLQNLEYTIEITDSEYKITPNFSQIPTSLDLTMLEISTQSLSSTIQTTTSGQITIPLVYNDSYFIMANFHDNKTGMDYFDYIHFNLNQPFSGTISLGKIRYQPLMANLSNVDIYYKNNAGAIYSTVSTDNSDPSTKFMINEILEGATAPSGRPTKLVKAVFSCYLTNQMDNTDVIYLSNITANLAFEY